MGRVPQTAVGNEEGEEKDEESKVIRVGGRSCRDIATYLTTRQDDPTLTLTAITEDGVVPYKLVIGQFLNILAVLHNNIVEAKKEYSNHTFNGNSGMHTLLNLVFANISHASILLRILCLISNIRS